ncbi:MAG: pyruvate ferredoxin oxidoreductase, partial [Chloroflexi bacterium]|nr:pyruvate ferredoxin oxidoreductase [Chloroflexota bacterium]
GWLHFYAESGQEAYDNTIKAIRIAEHPGLLTPVMSCQDGFITGHGVERVGILPDEAVREFVGNYQPKHALLDIANPVTMGARDFTDYYFEHKRQQTAAIEGALPIIDTYGMEDAEYAIIVLSSTAGTARTVARGLRAKGQKVGLVKPCVFRPFPAKQIVDIIKNCKAVAVLDRAISFGSPQGMGPLFLDTAAALYNEGVSGLPIVDYIYGLGGRDTVPPMVESVYADLAKIGATGERGTMVRYLGLRD